MLFRAKFEVIHDDGSKLPSISREYQAESWYQAFDMISENISNPPYEVFYHLDLIELKRIGE